MTKDEMIAHIAGETKLAKSQVESVLIALADLVTAKLKAGEEFQYRDLGTFKLKRSEARKGRNPQTGAAIDIPARNTAKFKPSSKLLDAIKG